MPAKRPLDIRAAEWLMRKAKSYKRKRLQQLDDSAWANYMATASKKVFALQNELSIHLYKDSILCQMIYSGFEHTETDFVQALLQPGETFFDIGSNIGLFSLYAARSVGAAGKVYAFEPTPNIFDRLKENISLNHFENIYPQNIGLSSETGTLTLHVSDDGRDGWNTFASGEAGRFAKKMEVPVTTLDVFVQQNNIDLSKLRMVKIDVEGWEIPVLKGAMHTIHAHDGIVIMTEFTERNLKSAGYSGSALYDLLANEGFIWCVYDAANNVLRFDAKRKEYPYNNLFAVKDVQAVNAMLQRKK